MGPDGGTTPDDTEESIPDTQPLSCVTCGSSIDRADWHPVRTWTDADGQFHIDVFCSMACRAEHEPAEE